MEARRRVKVYELLPPGGADWRDRGTGHCTCDYVERKMSTCIVVKSESNGAVLIESRVLRPGAYQRQQDSLIIWQEPDGNDIALSFQNVTGCNDIWGQISDIQTRIYGAEMDEENTVIENGSQHPLESSPSREHHLASIDLPKPTLANLALFESSLGDYTSPAMRGLLAAKIDHESYLDELKELFSTAEDMEMEETLHILYRIFKALVLLNELPLLERLIKDDFIMTLMGALEYDPEFADRRPHHREYLENNCTFKQVVPITNDEVTSKIHQTFKLLYLKDVVLPRVLDDNTFGSINSYVYFNNVDIVDKLRQDSDFLNELFDLVRKKPITTDKQKQAIYFIQEFCNISKGLQEVQKGQFYDALCDHGLFEIFAHSVNHEDVKLRLAATDILACLLDFQPMRLRTFLTEQQAVLDQNPASQPTTDDGSSLFRQLIRRIHEDDDEGMKTQFAEILKVLLENETIKDEDNNFLTMFYDKYVPILFENICRLVQDSVVWSKDLLKKDLVTAIPNVGYEDPAAQALITVQCDLLCMFIKRHTFRIKYFILSNSIASKIMILLGCKHKHVALSALRVFRAFVGSKDEFYLRYISRNNLFVPVFLLFREHENKNNLINSAVLELVDFVRRENLKSLIKDLVENYRSCFEHINYVKIFEQLILKYDQANEANKTSSSNAAATEPHGLKLSRDPRALDEDEEAYFNDDDDDDDDDGDDSSSSMLDDDNDEHDLRPRSLSSSSTAPATSSDPQHRSRSLSPPLVASPSATGSSPTKSPTSSPRSRSPPIITVRTGPKTIKLVDYHGGDVHGEGERDHHANHHNGNGKNKRPSSPIAVAATNGSEAAGDHDDDGAIDDEPNAKRSRHS